MATRGWWRAAFSVIALIACLPAAVSAQYFGRNKVQYRTFDFKILKTEHLDVYYYPEEEEAASIVARLGERWYSRFSRFFNHQLRGRQAVILYAAPAHFRQTNVIEGLIGEGTGGVTEAVKRRIVLPVSGSLAALLMPRIVDTAMPAPASVQVELFGAERNTPPSVAAHTVFPSGEKLICEMSA